MKKLDKNKRAVCQTTVNRLWQNILLIGANSCVIICVIQGLGLKL